MKKTKFPRFLLATNIRVKPVEEYIIYTRKPRFIAEVIKKVPELGMRKGNLEVEILEFWDTVDMEKLNLEWLKKRMIHWYVAQKTKP